MTDAMNTSSDPRSATPAEILAHMKFVYARYSETRLSVWMTTASAVSGNVKFIDEAELLVLVKAGLVKAVEPKHPNMWTETKYYLVVPATTPEVK